jgi:hypothetical protein
MKLTPTLAILAAGVVTASAGVRTAIPAPTPIRPAEPCAGPISYNNAELLYAYTDYDGFADHGSGGVFRLEYSAWDNFYIAAGATYSEIDSVDMWSLSAGVGAYMALTENIHLVGEAGVLWTSFETSVFVDDGSSAGTGFWVSDRDEEWGWYAKPHLRAKWGCLEVHAGALYTDLGGNFDDEWAGFVDLYYQVAPSWDLTAGVSFNSDATTVTGGARYRY